MNTLRTRDLQPCQLTVKLDNSPRACKSQDEATRLFEQAMSYHTTIQRELQSSTSIFSTLEKSLQNDIINSIYSSNFIERAALNFPQTQDHCSKIFAGESVSFPAKVEGDPEVERRYLETVLHAKA